MRAIIAFDPLAGYRFATYATIWIKQAITRYIANSGLIWIPVYRIELEQRVLAKINQFETKQGRSPNEKELADILDLEPAQVRAVLDEIRVLRRILRLEEPLKDRHQEENGDVFGDLVPDQHPLAEEELIAQEFSQETKRMLAEAPLIDLDKRIIELYFGLNGGDEHTLEYIGDILGVSGERIRQRLTRALDALRTRGNWERMSAFHQLRPLPEAESRARWDKAINALLNVLKEQEESEESWLLEQYLERLACHLELPLDKLVTETEDLELRQARMAAAALLWSPGKLKLEEIANRLKLQHLGAAWKAVHKVGLQLRKRKYDALAQKFEPPKPLEPLPESEEIEDDFSEENDNIETGQLSPVTPEEVSQVRAWLDKVELTPKQRLILEERLGLDKPRATLEEISQSLSLTRERVRQIQASAIKQIQENSVWSELQSFLEPIFKEIVRKYGARKSELR